MPAYALIFFFNLLNLLAIQTVSLLGPVNKTKAVYRGRGLNGLFQTENPKPLTEPF